MKKKAIIFAITTSIFVAGCSDDEKSSKTTTTPSSTSEVTTGMSTNATAEQKMETRDTRIGKLVFENGYPNHETLEKLYDERDFQRASQAYLWSLPAISMMDFVVSFQEDLGASFGDLIHLEGYDDASYGITANATTEYMVGFHDLTLSGPVVVSEPVGAMAGFVNDMWQRPVTDLGIPGKFGGRAGGSTRLVGLQRSPLQIELYPIPDSHFRD